MSSDNDSDLILNEVGICNHCINFEKDANELPSTKEAKHVEFNRQIEEIKENGKGKKYDAILGVSGGVDSTYLAWVCKEQGLRVLFVHCDNGWNSELAVANIQNLSAKTGYDLYTHVLDWPSFKDLQLAFLKSGGVDIELPYYYALYVLMFIVAKKFDISTVISGHNLVTEGTYMPKSWVHEKLDLKNILDIHKKFGTIKLKNYPKMGIIKFLYYKKTKKQKNYKLLNFIEYNKVEVKEFIKEKLGWRDYGGKHYESIFTRFYQGYILPRRFNIDKRQYHLSTLVQSGQLTRLEALSSMKDPIYDKVQFESDYEFVLKKFGLTHDEFEKYMDAPIKKHTDFKNIKSFWVKYFKTVAILKKILFMK